MRVLILQQMDPGTTGLCHAAVETFADHRVRLNTSDSLAAAFEGTCQTYSARPALIDGDRVYRYQWMLQAASRVCRELKTRYRLQSGANVALMMENSAEYVAAFYGTLLAGGVVVPVLPKIEGDRWQQIQQSANPAMLVSREQDLQAQADPGGVRDVLSSDEHLPLAALGLPDIACQAIGWTAAMLAVLAFLLTARCWFAMGSNWSMAITPKKQTQLITQGPFSLVRHPIYALSLLLMICTMVVAATPWMWLVGVIHIIMICGKAISEDRYLEQVHGEPYRMYRQATSRFLPCRWPSGFSSR